MRIWWGAPFFLLWKPNSFCLKVIRWLEARGQWIRYWKIRGNQDGKGKDTTSIWPSITITSTVSLANIRNLLEHTPRPSTHSLWIFMKEFLSFWGLGMPYMSQSYVGVFLKVCYHLLPLKNCKKRDWQRIQASTVKQKKKVHGHLWNLSS